MKWFGRAAAAAALIGVAVFGGWACSDDSGEALSLEEYFQKLDEAENTFTESGDAVFEDISEEPTTDEIAAAFDEFTNVLDKFVGALDDLSPPEEAAGAHEAAVEAGNATSDAYSDLVAAATDTESVDDLFSSAEGQAASEAIDQFQTACLDLQEVADSNNIEVDLNCNDEGE